MCLLLPVGVVFVAAISFCQLPVKYTPERFVTPLKPFIPCAAILAAIHLMFSLGWEAHALFLGWQIVAFVLYISYGMHHSAEPVNHQPTQVQMQPNERQGMGLLKGIAERSDHVSL